MNAAPGAGDSKNFLARIYFLVGAERAGRATLRHPFAPAGTVVAAPRGAAAMNRMPVRQEWQS
ncbi:hypothetical protein [Burkholderia plantarii]|uniref:hypothetical protein n=1 Tax=Burkholderia plantarii TaxID=41899 RepID=UPI000F4F979B|nr:hypothetical protein [Burkholderia plantarii]